MTVPRHFGIVNEVNRQIDEMTNLKPPIRACFQCIYGAVSDDATLVCECAQVSGMENPLPCTEARSEQGPCKPSAYFLVLKGE